MISNNVLQFSIFVKIRHKLFIIYKMKNLNTIIFLLVIHSIVGGIIVHKKINLENLRILDGGPINHDPDNLSEIFIFIYR